MDPARFVTLLLKSAISALVLLAIIASIAVILILAVRIFNGDELEPAGEMIAAFPGLLMKLIPSFVLSWGIILYTLMKRETSNGR